jgi:hypothetical protein
MTRCQTTSRNLHPQRLLLAAVTLAIASATLPTPAQTAAPQATQQLRAVPPAPRQPNYVMLDAKPAADPEEASDATPNNDANHVGLKLHGHWVIDVLNPDHSLAQHHVFENSLNPLSGASIILGLLSGYISAGTQAIQLSGSPTPCFSANYQGNGTYYCEMVTSTTVFPGKSDCTSPSNTYGYSYCATTLTAT